jgi:hypothetical protein
MFDDDDDDNDATEYDPSPWGSRQRLLPLASFVAGPAPITAPPIPPAVAYAAPIASMTYASIALTTPLMHAAAVARVSVAVPMGHAAPKAHAAPMAHAAPIGPVMSAASSAASIGPAMSVASSAAPRPFMAHSPSATPSPFMSPAPSAAPRPFITMRVPALPLHPRRRVHLAIPMLGFAAVLLLALAYALKPPTIAPQTASISNPATVEPLAMSSAGVAAETAPAATAPAETAPAETAPAETASAETARVDLAKPASALVHNAQLERSFDAKPAPRAAQKPRTFAKRRPIKIDASITSSPLGQLRPSRR